MKIMGITLFVLIVLLLGGCGILGGPANVNDARPTNTPLRWYVPAATLTPIPSITPPNPIPVSGLSTPPSISVSIATNCRRGPSADYDILLAFFPGEAALVIGKYTPSNYWVITTLNGYTCWLWGQNATLTGDINSIPEYPVPPLPSPTYTATPLPNDTVVPANTPAPTLPPPSDNPAPRPKPTKAPKSPKFHGP